VIDPGERRQDFGAQEAVSIREDADAHGGHYLWSGIQWGGWGFSLTA
jgi:hypothetical protein